MTKIFNIDPRNFKDCELEESAKILNEGGTVAFPTETVYGIGANALEEEAVKKIFEAKGRPSDNPLIVHISKEDQLKELAKDINKNAQLLIEKFWPGPLTIILNKRDKVPNCTTGGLNTVAIRMPSHRLARKLIGLSKVPVAAPSANISGKPSPTKGEHVVKDLKNRVDGIICGGHVQIGLESTVIDATGEVPIILRPGGVTKEEIEEALNMEIKVDPAIEGYFKKDLTPKSPGMKYTHYSPEAQVVIVTGNLEDTAKKIIELKKDAIEEGKKVGIMCTDETKEKYDGLVYSMGSRKKISTIALNMFHILRLFDETDVDIIFAEGIESAHLGSAIMNRMTKAAGYNIIKC
ncbi:MAG: L-threonylcarbamoyladenylate synthase [Anaeromicrobium sp.]|jgi:L-threonylcarbamoyladenylate synthase|uniref:L-threonylcarbamoyladenylate synthase n=1 Tax=Anaeromicrobium sp. TaxID=1929132 RepID=UPI0025F53368|nr:L-threonylcarbamoyladenylate synthase [Anaeromicrobium sp.]MCT4592754.1 L-threonylcarbamoyladenylate synthase [Anaeromicrobium sp.]